ncbi:SAV_915 family protein [Streptomyces sp. NPDC049916]|uniref:SAV_915 family protein n=1 Tax=unclassified Streptomyces TaxID=2593676 RepID=UPI0034190C6F
MCLYLYDDDPDPDEQAPVRPLYVPVRSREAGSALRLFRTPLGERTAVGFSRPELLAATLGAGHPAVRLAEPALRALAAPLGVGRLVVDPVLSAPAVTASAACPADVPARAL